MLNQTTESNLAKNLKTWSQTEAQWSNYLLIQNSYLASILFDN